jgi:hypothetical protein
VKNPLIVSTTKGIKLLNHFVSRIMINAHKYNKISYTEAWNNPKTRRLLVERMIDKDIRVNNGSLYGCYGCKYGRLYNFPPNVARYIYNTYGNCGRVLDSSAGYAGRLLAYWTSNCVEYIGIDPNVQVPYDKIAEYLTSIIPKKYKVYNACSEDFDYEPLGKFDLVFTSPPYFNTEIYSEDPSQSCHKYSQPDIWLEKFLFATLNKCYHALKPGGVMAINIKNCGKHELVEPMLEYMESIGLKEKERICMLQAKRYSNNKTYEYIYVFTK